MELFKQLPNTYYLVGNKGTIIGTNKPLSQKTKSNGYKEVALYIDKVQKMKYVHRLVAECWIGDIPDNHVINHKDGDKSNNCVQNLEIVTHSGNMWHSHHKLGNRTPSFKGQDHPMTKLTKDDVYKIRELYEDGMSTRVIHKMFNDKISLSALRKICYRSTWTHI